MAVTSAAPAAPEGSPRIAGDRRRSWKISHGAETLVS